MMSKSCAVGSGTLETGMPVLVWAEEEEEEELGLLVLLVLVVAVGAVARNGDCALDGGLGVEGVFLFDILVSVCDCDWKDGK